MMKKKFRQKIHQHNWGITAKTLNRNHKLTRYKTTSKNIKNSIPIWLKATIIGMADKIISHFFFVFAPAISINIPIVSIAAIPKIVI